MNRCPECGEPSKPGDAIGDGRTCGRCGTRFWVLPGIGTGKRVAPPEKAPPSAVSVAGLHLGVLLAEAVLAGSVAGLLIGLPVFGVGRLMGIW